MIFSGIQNTFIANFSNGFVSLQHQALLLFYGLAGIEIVIFGIIWALKQNEMLGAFLFKVLKLAFVFFVISNYPSLLQALINGFTDIAFAATSPKIATFFFDPSKLWQFGFDASDSLLNLAVTYGTSSMGAAMLYLILGFGTLLLFGLLGAQIICMVVAFYVVSLVALLLIPFGALTVTENFFYRAVSQVFKVGVMVLALILILGVAVSVWATLNVTSFSNTTTIDQPLGLFFSALIFYVLALKIPKFARDAVGELGGRFFTDTAQTSVSVSAPAAASQPALAGVSNVSQVAAGASLNVAAGTSLSSPASVSVASSLHSASGAGGGGAASGAGGLSAAGPLAGLKADLHRASQVQKEGISRDTLNKLKASFKQILKETKK